MFASLEPLFFRCVMILLHNCHKRFDHGSQRTHVLKGVSCTINDGEFVAIMGPSWSGKSTLMNIIGMLDTLSEGEYTFWWTRIDGLPESQVARIRGRSIGFVFQWYNLIKRMKAIDQVRLPLSYQGFSWHESADRAMHALTVVWLSDKAVSYPSELSWWQQQRVAIARALAINPRMLLCDEPTGALDSQTTEEVMKLFVSLHQAGTTIVMITHDPGVAAYSHRCITIRDGMIVSN